MREAFSEILVPRRVASQVASKDLGKYLLHLRRSALQEVIHPRVMPEFQVGGITSGGGRQVDSLHWRQKQLEVGVAEFVIQGSTRIRVLDESTLHGCVLGNDYMAVSICARVGVIAVDARATDEFTAADADASR